MKVFVTGALGFIGRALVERYRAGGAEVLAMERSSDTVLGIVAGDVTEPSPWQDRLRGCDLMRPRGGRCRGPALRDTEASSLRELRPRIADPRRGPPRRGRGLPPGSPHALRAVPLSDHVETLAGFSGA